MSNNNPRVSIGLPVYNGENYLREALDSILAQTFEDFELIISDNASTDRTEEICKEYAAKDRRIRYYRNEQNLGAAPNYNRVFELSRGEYFKWAAHDDVCAPEYLKRCVEVLDQDSSVVLCYTQTGKIDERGELVGTYDVLMNVDSQNPCERFHDLVLLDFKHLCMPVFGVIRASALRMSSLIAPYVGSDNNLLAELGLIGRFYKVPEYLFFRREHSQASIRKLSVYKRLVWFDSKKANLNHLSRWRRTVEYFICVTRMPLSWSERLLCYVYIGQWSGRRWRRMARDLRMAAKNTLLFKSAAR